MNLEDVTTEDFVAAAMEAHKNRQRWEAGLLLGFGLYCGGMGYLFGLAA